MSKLPYHPLFNTDLTQVLTYSYLLNLSRSFLLGKFLKTKFSLLCLNPVISPYTPFLKKKKKNHLHYNIIKRLSFKDHFSLCTYYVLSHFPVHLLHPRSPYGSSLPPSSSSQVRTIVSPPPPFGLADSHLRDPICPTPHSTYKKNLKKVKGVPNPSTLIPVPSPKTPPLTLLK